MKPFKIVVIITLFFFISTAFLYKYCYKTLPLVPLSGKNSIITYSDMTSYKDKPGNSTISDIKMNKDSSFTYSFTLGDSADYPYSGIYVFNNDSSEYDFSNFSMLKITFGNTNITHFKIEIKTFIEGITTEEYELSKRYNVIELPKKVDEESVLIKKADIKTPGWWYIHNNLTPDQLKKNPDWRRTMGLAFFNSQFCKTNTKYNVTIKEIEMLRSKIPFYVSFAFALCSLFLLVILKNRKFSVKEKKNNIVEYTPISVSNICDDEFIKIKKCVGDYYSDANFSVSVVSQETGISERQIGKVIKSKTNGNFKNYLNKIRLEEAKRLLVKTDRRVTEISYLVGYNYPSHFNRLFFEYYGTSPTQLRKELKSASDNQDSGLNVIKS